jgi:hypothetical protein
MTSKLLCKVVMINPLFRPYLTQVWRHILPVADVARL